MKVSQSSRLRGEKSLVAAGQLDLSFERRISRHEVHFTIAPAEYGPFIVTRSHLHDFGLPGAGSVDISETPEHVLASILPFATAGRGANSAFLYAGV
jgi:hypothetical protein